MPVTHSQGTTNRSSDAPMAQTLDPTKLKLGWKKAQPEQNNFDIPDIPAPCNPTEPAGLKQQKLRAKYHPQAAPACSKDKDASPLPPTDNRTWKCGHKAETTIEPMLDGIPPPK